MSTKIKETVRKNIANCMGVASYEELIKAGVHEERRIVALASKKMKDKKLKVNPYDILGLKVNVKGKIIRK